MNERKGEWEAKEKRREGRRSMSVCMTEQVREWVYNRTSESTSAWEYSSTSVEATA